MEQDEKPLTSPTSATQGQDHRRDPGKGRGRSIHRGHFPNDDAATKLLWLALRNVMSKSIRSIREWKIAMNQFAILYGERFTGSRS